MQDQQRNPKHHSKKDYAGSEKVCEIRKDTPGKYKLQAPF